MFPFRKNKATLIVLLTLTGITFFLALFFYPARSVYTTNASVPDIQKPAPNALPVRLKIPSIGVDALIEQVGLTSSGAVGVPKGPTDVAWFNKGPLPGSEGSAVIVGHEGWKDGIRAVFDDLNKVRVGDTIFVQDSEGKTLSFVVREIRTYAADANAPEVFSSIDGVHLNLITCGGAWDASGKSYTRRLVIFSDAEPVPAILPSVSVTSGSLLL